MVQTVLKSFVLFPGRSAGDTEPSQRTAGKFGKEKRAKTACWLCCEVSVSKFTSCRLNLALKLASQNFGGRLALVRGIKNHLLIHEKYPDLVHKIKELSS